MSECDCPAFLSSQQLVGSRSGSQCMMFDGNDRYLNRADATAEAFDEAGWFMTGDIACYDYYVDDAASGVDSDRGGYKILGRASVDIIKSAGYKLSALEIERAILEHKAVRSTQLLSLLSQT